MFFVASTLSIVIYNLFFSYYYYYYNYIPNKSNYLFDSISNSITTCRIFPGGTYAYIIPIYTTYTQAVIIIGVSMSVLSLSMSLNVITMRGVV